MAVDVLFEVWHATVTDLQLTVFLLKILCKTYSLVNAAASSLGKVLPMLVQTFCNWGMNMGM